MTSMCQNLGLEEMTERVPCSLHKCGLVVSDDAVYFPPAAVAVFFAIVDAGYAPKRALQLSAFTHAP